MEYRKTDIWGSCVGEMKGFTPGEKSGINIDLSTLAFNMFKAEKGSCQKVEMLP